MTTQPVINPSEYEEIMLNILNKMDYEFGGKTFAKMCRISGIPSLIISNGLTTRFLKKKCIRIGNKNSKLWKKFEDWGYRPEPKIKESMNQFSFKPEIQQAIDLLKSEGCFEITYQIKKTLKP
jgi:hypothetical protein